MSAFAGVEPDYHRNYTGERLYPNPNPKKAPSGNACLAHGSSSVRRQTCLTW